MAINKEGNGYTFLFAILLVAVVGAALAGIAVGLKPYQEKNEAIGKQMDILKAIGLKDDSETKKDNPDMFVNRQNAEEQFDKYIDIESSVVINRRGELLEGENPMSIDVQKQYRDTKIKADDRKYPLFVSKPDAEGKRKYIVPMVGKGLWGPIWGFVAVNDDFQHVSGAVFDHKTETPGLGAEIAANKFEADFTDEEISEAGVFIPFTVTKGSGSEGNIHAVDGITGGTITSKGVERMLNETLRIYNRYFQKISNN